jgi:hypothetical protein
MDNTRLLAGFQREQWQGFSLEERKKKKKLGGEYIIPTRGAVLVAAYYYCWEFAFLLPLDS